MIGSYYLTVLLQENDLIMNGYNIDWIIVSVTIISDLMLLYSV